VHRPPIPGAEHAFSVDTYSEALKLQRHVAALAESSATPGGEARFTAVVVGAGFTGVEVATELITTLRTVAATAAAGECARLVLVERASFAAPDLGSAARQQVEQALATLGIGVRTGHVVTAIHPDGVMLDDGEWISAATTVWTGGFRANDLAAHLPVERDAMGRVPVDGLLRIRGVDGVYAAGDVARAMADEEHVAPMSCQYAIPMGERAGENAVADLIGLPAAPYAQPDYVTCLDLGEAGALFMQGWERDVKLTGIWAKRMKQTINNHLIYPPRQWQARSA
jgi:NADH dehydrogenase